MTPAASIDGRGAPSKYHGGLPDIVKKLVGEPSFMTDEQVCIVIGIDRATFYRWKHKHPEFRDALTRTREQLANAICGAMAKAAMGYSVDSVKIMSRPVTTETIRTVRGKEVKTITKTVEFVPVPFQEHIPPNERAGEFLLTNIASGQFQRGGVEAAPVVQSDEEIRRLNAEHEVMMRAIRENAAAGGKPFFTHEDLDEVPALAARARTRNPEAADNASDELR